jgi:mRNA interferase RelE/StbE
MKGFDVGETVTISRAEYEQLVAAAEDVEDYRAVRDFLSHPQAGMPGDLVKRLVDGESPLRVYREWRGQTQSSLARLSGVNRVQIADIEAGRRSASLETFRKLANALETTIDEIA